MLQPASRRTSSLVLLIAFALPRAAYAGAEPHRPEEEGDEVAPIDLGVLGGIGFPTPLSVEAVVGVRKTFMFGAEYGFLPTTTIGPVDASLWAAAADFRFFPFKGSFFVGLRTGYQRVTAAATLTARNAGSYTESVAVGTWFVNPKLGFLWSWKPFALGLDAGLQLPIATTVSRSSLLSVVAPDIDAGITTATDLLGRSVLPTLDLLRIGLLY